MTQGSHPRRARQKNIHETPASSLKGLRKNTRNHENCKKNGPGFLPRMWAGDAPSGVSVSIEQAREAHFFGPGSRARKAGANPGPFFCEKLRNRTGRMGSIWPQPLWLPCAEKMGTSPPASSSRYWLRRNRARSLSGVLPEIPCGAGGPGDPPSFVRRRYQLHAGIVRPWHQT